MTRHLLCTSAAAAGALAAVAPAAALAKPAHHRAAAPTRAHAHAYERTYRRVAHQLGARVPGRNIIEDGVAGHDRVTDARTLSSLHVLRRMLAPAPAAATVSTASASASTGASTTTATSSGVPSCASESGTDYSTGASNTNASSGATGRYQILPSTAAAYGCNLGTPAGQDACAGEIYAHQGASAWVGCGG